MKDRFRITVAGIDITTREKVLRRVCFANCLDAFNYAFRYGRYFVSFRDEMKDITIYDIDALTAYYENMMI